MDRRDFLFRGTTTVALATLSLSAKATTSNTLPPKNLIFTQENAGKWEKKRNSHIPDIVVKDGKVSIITNHGQSPRHYIVRHTLLLADGTVIGSTTFTHDDLPESVHALPTGYKGALFATSFCNKHDLWLAETIV
ncbi:MAG: desulfoferrodoxin family protein [Candidatus Thiodiazotropha sp.]